MAGFTVSTQPENYSGNLIAIKDAIYRLGGRGTANDFVGTPVI